MMMTLAISFKEAVAFAYRETPEFLFGKLHHLTS